MEKVLYRKYRSKSLDEVVGQPHITETLQNALNTNSVSHAYLFTGPRGVGKTSIARIFAHAVNQLPYDESQTHLDIIEIDAASNRRIDEIRDLRDKVHIAPTSATYKVYIIDEVHMLTKEAFNALLKTLEEPPAHVIFILATTELHKLPETIVSRTQHFAFHAIKVDDAVQHLQYIAKEEGIELDEPAARLIAEHSQGSFRDSISLLDKLRSFDTVINAESTKRALGLASNALIDDLLMNVANGTPASLLSVLEAAYSEGLNATTLSKQLAASVRARLLGGGDEKFLSLYKELTLVSSRGESSAALEIALLEAQIHNSPSSQTEQPVFDMPSLEEPTVILSQIDPVQPQSKTAREDQAPHSEPTQSDAAANEPIASTTWELILADIKKSHNTLYGIVRMAQPELDDKKLTLYFNFPFHYKQVIEAKNSQRIREVVNNVDQNLVLDFQLRGAQPMTRATPTEQKPDITTINNIFGKSEVLES